MLHYFLGITIRDFGCIRQYHSPDSGHLRPALLDKIAYLILVPLIFSVCTASGSTSLPSTRSFITKPTMPLPHWSAGQWACGCRCSACRYRRSLHARPNQRLCDLARAATAPPHAPCRPSIFVHKHSPQKQVNHGCLSKFILMNGRHHLMIRKKHCAAKLKILG